MTKLAGASSKPSGTTSIRASFPQISHESVFVKRFGDRFCQIRIRQLKGRVDVSAHINGAGITTYPETDEDCVVLAHVLSLSLSMPRIEKCRKCGDLFVVEGGQTGPMIDSEDIKCPHCGALWGSERIADVFRTRSLTSAEQSAYARSTKR